ncbi:helix-turn-helix transcriptional regulator [Methanobrevibacter sp.]|uniref:helix-turn-helix transcriptional regulator n=1 Tax=Methanobrevibacter sp. TaxID=66852 RepID=UPI00388D9C4B
MIKSKEHIKNFDTIFEDVKFTANSLVRLKVLAALFDKPQNIKTISDKTGIGYSSVSSTIHDLELKNWVYRERNKYYLTTSTRVRIENVLELDQTLVIINEFFNILDGHLVDMIPNESVLELYLLGKAYLMESQGVDVYRIYKFIENSLSDSESVKCIMPIYYDPFFEVLNNLISENKDVEIYVPQNLLAIFEEKSGIKTLKPFDEIDSFLLIITDKSMILGFFMDNGFFDQNRVLTSKNKDSLIWANNLFENFKKGL